MPPRTDFSKRLQETLALKRHFGGKFADASSGINDVLQGEEQRLAVIHGQHFIEILSLLTQAVRSSAVHSMNSVMAAPVDWIEPVGNLRFPSKADHRLQELMDGNNEGLLSKDEREQLEALAELSERLSLKRTSDPGQAA